MSLPLFLAADERYFPGLLATAVTTMASTSNPNAFIINIFDGGICDASKTLLENSVRALGYNNQIQWLPVTLASFQNLPSMNGNLLAYVRLLIPELTMADRAIWLDTDLLVFRDCGALAEFDLSRNLAAAAEEDFVFSEDVTNMQDLGIPATSKYYNTGVLILDVARLRKFKFTERSIDYLNANVGKYQWYDQSAINVVLNGQIADLDQHWNYLNRIHYKDPNNIDVVDGNYIYHFLERPKPWQRYSGEEHALFLYKLLKLLHCPTPELSSFDNLAEWSKWQWPNAWLLLQTIRIRLSKHSRQIGKSIERLELIKHLSKTTSQERVDRMLEKISTKLNVVSN